MFEVNLDSGSSGDVDLISGNKLKCVNNSCGFT
jgi:hypothetical protein